MELKNNEKEIIFKDKYSMSLKENILTVLIKEKILLIGLLL